MVGLDPLFARLLAASYPIGATLSVHGADGSLVSGEFVGLDVKAMRTQAGWP